MEIKNLNYKYGKSTLLKDLIFSSIILVLLCFFAFVFEIWFAVCKVEQSSMQPTLYPNDVLLIDKLSDYERKDIIVFKHDGKLLIKRVIAFEGETVYTKNGKVYVKRTIKNGQVIDVELDEPYLSDSTTTDFEGKEFVVNKGEIFVLGDNRLISNDSSSSGFEPVKREDVIGVIHDCVIKNRKLVKFLLD